MDEPEAVAEVGPVVELDFERRRIGSPSMRRVLVGKFGFGLEVEVVGCRDCEVDRSRALEGPGRNSDGDGGEAARVVEGESTG